MSSEWVPVMEAMQKGGTVFEEGSRTRSYRTRLATLFRSYLYRDRLRSRTETRYGARGHRWSAMFASNPSANSSSFALSTRARAYMASASFVTDANRTSIPFSHERDRRGQGRDPYWSRLRLKRNRSLCGGPGPSRRTPVQRAWPCRQRRGPGLGSVPTRPVRLGGRCRLELRAVSRVAFGQLGTGVRTAFLPRLGHIGSGRS